MRHKLMKNLFVPINNYICEYSKSYQNTRHMNLSIAQDVIFSSGTIKGGAPQERCGRHPNKVTRSLIMSLILETAEAKDLYLCPHTPD
jgi:hypothetical protein